MAVLQQRLDERQREIDSLRDELRRLRHALLVDSLTVLANRLAFDGRLSAQAMPPGRPPTGLPVHPWMLDIDHLERVSDRHGHAVERITVSVGMAAWPDENPVAMVDRADHALPCRAGRARPGAQWAESQALGGRESAAAGLVVGGQQIRPQRLDDLAHELAAIPALLDRAEDGPGQQQRHRGPVQMRPRGPCRRHRPLVSGGAERLGRGFVEA